MNSDGMTDETLKGLLQVRQLPRKAKLLGILAVENARPKGQRQIRATARELGLNEVRRWRLGEILAQAGDAVRLSRGGWQLTRAGIAYVEALPQLLLQMQAESAANDAPATEHAGTPESTPAVKVAAPRVAPAATGPHPAKPAPTTPRVPTKPRRR
jgi:hypothetical protein